jgi:hypothetical protein
MIEVRRPSDGELCGHVRPGAAGWHALTVFGGTLGVHPDRDAAMAQVHEHGLASLAERWWYRPDPSATWQVVCIQEASTQAVRIALDFYSLPGVPTVTLSRDQVITEGSLVREPGD